MKNKIMVAGALFLMLGMVGAAQQTQQIQFNSGQVFENEDTRLNAVYAVDQQSDFYGFLFSDGQANLFGTVDSFNALQGDNIRVCQHYLTERGGFLGGVNPFSNERTQSEVRCVQLQGNISSGQTQVPLQPQQNQNLPEGEGSFNQTTNQMR